jgi:hypothetical protein
MLNVCIEDAIKTAVRSAAEQLDKFKMYLVLPADQLPLAYLMYVLRALLRQLSEARESS